MRKTRSPVKRLKSPVRKQRSPVKRSPVRKQKFRFKPFQDLTFSEKQKIVQEIEGKKSFINFIEQTIDENWEWGRFRLSSNQNITSELVLKYPNKGWDWLYVSKNPAINIQDILVHPELPWNPSFHPDLTISIVLDNPDINWNWMGISSNSGIQIKDIVENPELPWNWKSMLENPNITCKFIERNINKFERYISDSIYSVAEIKDLSVGFIRRYFHVGDLERIGFLAIPNSAIPIDDIINNPDIFDFDSPYNGLDKRTDITPEIIQQYPELNWWDFTNNLFGNPNITMEFIQENLDKPWNWFILVRDGIITEEFFHENYLDARDMKNLNERDIRDFRNSIQESVPFFSFDFIERHLDLPWDNDYLSSNTNIGLNFILRHPEIEWDWNFLSSNPRIWYAYVVGISDRELPWDCGGLSTNNGLYDNDIFNKVYDEYLYLQTGHEVSELLGDDITESMIGKYLTGREMTRPRDRYRE